MSRRGLASADARFRRRRFRGVSMAELVMCLSICSVLLLAVGVAFNASASAVEVNDDFFRASHAARVALAQMQTAIRRCDVCEVPSPDRVRLITEDGKDRSYVYDAATKRILLVTNDSLTDADYVLARNVRSASFAADSENIPGTTTPRVVRVTMDIDVQVREQEIRLSAAVVPRRAVVPETN